MTHKPLPADLPAILRARGLKVAEISGWQTRGRGPEHGGFDPIGVLWHHTADKADGKGYAEWLAETGRPDLPPPLCQLSIGRDGTVYVCAAGRANHAGVAKASGPMPAGDGNEVYAGVEVQNTGSEGFAEPQYDAMVLTGATLALDVLDGSPQGQRGHKETSVTGKIDPRPLDMEEFRGDLAIKMAELTAADHAADPGKHAGRLAQAIALLEKALDAAIAKGNTQRTTRIRVAIKQLEKAKSGER